MQRKKLLAVGLLALAVAIMLAVSLLTKEKTQATACQDLIYGMERGETEETYAMLSDPAKTQTTPEAWQEQVAYIQRVYKGLEKPIELQDREETTSVVSDQLITTETYRVVTDHGPWQATCTFYESDGGLISNFTTDIGV